MSTIPPFEPRVIERDKFDLTKSHHVQLISLLEKQPNYPSGDGEIVKYATSGNLEKVKECLKSGSCINEVGDSGRINALMMAVHKGNNDVVKYLIENGADLHFINNAPYCDTPLHWAAYYKNPRACKMLLEAGAIGDIPNFSGVTPLDDARNHCTECEALIQEYLACSIASRKRIEKFRETLLKNPASDIEISIVENL